MVFPNIKTKIQTFENILVVEVEKKIILKVAMVYINLFITFSNFLQDNTKCFNTSCRILNLTAAVTLVLINKYTVIIATNRLGRNIKTNTKNANVGRTRFAGLVQALQ